MSEEDGWSRHRYRGRGNKKNGRLARVEEGESAWRRDGEIAHGCWGEGRALEWEVQSEGWQEGLEGGRNRGR
eukprot:1156197-Rhodomonas_salina.1